MPTELAAIEILRSRYPSLPQVACFDTAFHRTMPRVAQLYGLPRHILDAGVLRYGFHGLSYEYIVGELAREASSVGKSLTDHAGQRLVIAHLGNGASMVAIRDGHSVDTTMGLTPIGGLVMSTRSGDLDPGVLLYLLDAEQMNSADLRRTVEQAGGLLGISGSTSDMQDLLERMDQDPHVAEAVALFCYTARKQLGALASVLGGIDTLVFTAGVGEHAAEVRHRICGDQAYLGIRLDQTRNAAHASVISQESSPVTVRVIPTNEQLMIARHTLRTLRSS
jgi:acetate kinase